VKNAILFKKTMKNSSGVDAPFVYGKQHGTAMLPEDLCGAYCLIAGWVRMDVDRNDLNTGYAAERTNSFTLDKVVLVKECNDRM
jgi:hypothetical protein